MVRSLSFLMVFVLGTTTACAEVRRTVTGSSELDGEWSLASDSDDGGDFKLSPLDEVTLEVDGESMSGFAPCNSHGGTVDVDDTSIAADPMNVTAMACNRGDVMEIESRYLAALETVDSYNLEGDALTLTGPKTELIYETVPPGEQASFDGTEWRLESLIEGVDGEGLASSTLGGSLTFADDGSFEGFTGCRDITGAWEEEGELITTSEIELGARRCGRVEAEQDEHVVSVLEASFTVEIVEDAMTLEAAAIDRGLAYTAEG